MGGEGRTLGRPAGGDGTATVGVTVICTIVGGNVSTGCIVVIFDAIGSNVAPPRKSSLSSSLSSLSLPINGIKSN